MLNQNKQIRETGASGRFTIENTSTLRTLTIRDFVPSY
jgi:hypothetical protein